MGVMFAPDNYSVREYGGMISDRQRMDAFAAALREAIQPGDVVLDIGTGTGVFALLARSYGAARVYAVEPGDVIEVARRCERDNPGECEISWIQAISTQVELPERVDVVIADLHGSLPFHPANIASMNDARRRHLKPKGRIIPLRDTLYAVPAQATDEYADLEEPWSGNRHQLRLDAARNFVSNSIWRARPAAVDPSHLLAAPASWGTVDYSEVDSPDLDGCLSWKVERAGKLHGFYVWFDCETAPGFGFSNAPTLPSLVYGRSFFPAESALEVSIGDRIQMRISANLVTGEYIFRWRTRIFGADGILRADFRQSTFAGQLITAADLRRASSDWQPKLNADGVLDLKLLQEMANGRSLDAIASDARETNPGRFASQSDARAHVSRLAARYTER